MRLVLINHLHPATGLVGSVRFWRLAEELAKRGHRVVLLCGKYDSVDKPETLRKRFDAHDWSTPLLVACGPNPLLDARAESRQRSRFAGRVRTAWDLLVHGGPFWNWRAEARPLYKVLHERFDPHFCYATFGNLDALGIARELAKVCRIPWVMDIKDPADAFLPGALRLWLMRPYRDAAAVTMNAGYQRQHNPGWARAAAKVMYSGVESPLIPAPAVDQDRYALVGAVYDDQSLIRLLQGFRYHFTVQAKKARLVYYGKDAARVRLAADAIGLCHRIDYAGMFDRYAMLAECSSAAAICYVGHPGTFHHKLLELAALGRPLLACPNESEEGLSLIREHQIEFTGSVDEAALAMGLRAAATMPTRDTSELQQIFGWPTVARQLEELFYGLLGRKEYID